MYLFTISAMVAPFNGADIVVIDLTHPLRFLSVVDCSHFLNYLLADVVAF